jgi:Zn-dependent metalloprotease
MCDRRPFECIVPPHILERLLESKDRHVREAALKTLLTSTQIRTQRSLVGALPGGTAAGEKRRTIYDAKNMEPDPPSGTLIRGEGDQPSRDAAVNEAYDGLGATYDFYRQVLDRNSLDGSGMRLDGIVHYGEGFNNAFWDGQRMVFGDGDGELFGGFTKSLDVIAHELTHGVTEFTAGLDYHNQPGALNESVSDAFGSVVKQWSLQQTADAADWLIGAEVFTPALAGDALRSLKAPGTAYDNQIIGKDPQPARMSEFRTLPDTRSGDNGGVHINSGIPNRAFFLVATGIGGNAWDAPAHIWYETLTKNCGPQAQFQDFADATFGVAGRLYGAASPEQQAVRDAWAEVGIRVAGAGSIRPTVAARAGSRSDHESLVMLHAKVDELSKTVDMIAKHMTFTVPS